MIAWIESQSLTIVFLIAFGFCYVIALLIWLGARAVANRKLAEDLKATTPGIMPPLSVFVAVLIGFIAARVWANYDRAHAYIGAEGSALREAGLLADALPADSAAAIHKAIGDYLRFVATEDWPAMQTGTADLRQEPAPLAEALRVVLAAAPAGVGPAVAQQRATIALEDVLAARHGRILLSREEISPIQWAAMILTAVMVLLIAAMVHIERSRTVAINLAVYATSVAICLTMLLIYDLPFGPAGRFLAPEPLHELGADQH